MQLFNCQCCGQVVYFDNTSCLRCGVALAFLPDLLTVSAVEQEGGDWIARANPAARYRTCANRSYDACNWVLSASEPHAYCRACRHNRIVPDLSDPSRLQAWQRIEFAKHQLFYSLLRLRLPTPAPGSGDPEPLVFEFLADPVGGPQVLTGHDGGVITLSINEADDAAREATRQAMDEPYRTLLGHFRHEVGHYYWSRLVAGAGDDELARFRAVFGDERADYGEALARHYADGPRAGWQDGFVSAYATMHPWEDWAETWAHYLHIVDTLEVAASFGIRIAPDADAEGGMEAAIDFDPHRVHDIQRLIDAWLPLTYAVNNLNRAMGQPDLYPFVIAPAVVGKLGYVHDLIRRQAQAGLPA